jgi:RHH-type transcriptional regulator, rel operon repressor / antitoxin RelB
MGRMTITVEVDVDLKDRLDRAAAGQNKTADALVQQALEQFLGHDTWFRAEVEGGLREANAGDFLTPEEKAAAYKRWPTSAG